MTTKLILKTIGQFLPLIILVGLIGGCLVKVEPVQPPSSTPDLPETPEIPKNPNVPGNS